MSSTGYYLTQKSCTTSMGVEDVHPVSHVVFFLTSGWNKIFCLTLQNYVTSCAGFLSHFVLWSIRVSKTGFRKRSCFLPPTGTGGYLPARGSRERNLSQRLSSSQLWKKKAVDFWAVKGQAALILNHSLQQQQYNPPVPSKSSALGQKRRLAPVGQLFIHMHSKAIFKTAISQTHESVGVCRQTLFVLQHALSAILQLHNLLSDVSNLSHAVYCHLLSEEGTALCFGEVFNAWLCCQRQSQM